ncbi:uncharacterized protein LOC116293638 [Actinia tenebrosa]|uniref:Uncharacterized protein LOC116293638 n=1 Tax=Actinia tenebrosa TaxID=6105 RepID=A0A6P8HKP9_ACTTE|nr:uncharacterized protein LOC116293638 [Actinia tenebrosa]
MASLNITSLVAHIDELRSWVIQQNFDLLCINESRLDPSIPSSMVSIEGYDIHRSDRNRNGGGVCLYLKKGVNGKNRSDLTDDKVESLCFEIMKPNSKSFAVLACYRPPNYDTRSFFNIFENVLTKIDSEFKEIYILGDLNCDLLSTNINQQTRYLNTTAELFQLTQLITEPTRVTEKSKTLIDVILTNSPDRVVRSGVVHIGISDHSLVYTIRKIAIPTNNNHCKISFRSAKNFDSDKFLMDLATLPWDCLDNKESPDDMWDRWKELFLSVLDSHAPIKTKRIRNKKSPWMTTDLRKAMYDRDKMKQKATQTNSRDDWSDYKSIRNRVNNEIKRAKKSYYENHFA